MCPVESSNVAEGESDEGASRLAGENPNSMLMTTVVLLHGFTQTRQSWRRTVAAVGGRYRALAPDLPGHGLAAERRPASFAACAAYVRALAGERVVLAGYSMGGRIALYTALTMPGLVDRLVLVGASPGIADAGEREQRARADEELARRIETMDVATFAAEWGAQDLFAGQDARVAAAAHADRLRNTPAGLAAALRGLGTGVMPPLWDRLGELAVPVTLVVGERDAKFRAIAGRMAPAIPDCRVEVVDGAGHAAQLERPEIVAAAIRGTP
jgi:2-succinyl-6-hydroxy-2,4-cyclohexadiene-1-carboxylate synthase